MIFKRIICIFTIIVIALSSISCAPSKKSVFEEQAKSFFNEFTSEGVKATEVIEYSKQGSVAYRQPETEVEALDSELSVYYNKLVGYFFETEKTDANKLFITFEIYKPCDDIIGVEVISRELSEDGLSVEMKAPFNYNKMAVSGEEIPDDLKRLALIYARDALKTTHDAKALKEAEPKMLYTDKGVRVSYKDFENAVTVVPYEKLYYSLPESLKSKITPDSARAVDINKKMVALTFDDGPHGVYTDELLDILEKYNAVATFFEVGQNVDIAPEAIKRAYDMGCEIGSHSYSHANLKTSSADKIKSELDKTNEKLKAVTGEMPTLLRPPYGEVGSSLRDISEQYLIGWSVDTMDWKYRNADSVINYVKREKSLDGDVILMHSLYKSTVDAVEELVPWLIENDYQLVTITELMMLGEQDNFEKGVYYHFGN